MGFDGRAETHLGDRPGGHVHLESAAFRIFHRRIDDSIQILLFNAVRVHKDKRPHAVPGKLLDDGTTRTRAANHGDSKPPQSIVGARTECLRDTSTELRDDCPLSVPMTRTKGRRLLR